MSKKGLKLCLPHVSRARGSMKALTMLLSNLDFPLDRSYVTRPDSCRCICYILLDQNEKTREKPATTQISKKRKEYANWTRLDIPVQFILHHPTNDNAQLYYTSYDRINFEPGWANDLKRFLRPETRMA